MATKKPERQRPNIKQTEIAYCVFLEQYYKFAITTTWRYGEYDTEEAYRELAYGKPIIMKGNSGG
jgi:hypothetical protein